MAPCVAAPADQQQVAFGRAVHRRRLQRLLQRRELEAAHAQAFLVDRRVVGHLAHAVVGQAGDGVHAAGLAGDEAPRDAGDRVPVVGLGAFGYRRLVDRRRQPVFAELRPREGLLRRGQAGVGQHDDDHVEGLGDLARRDHRIEAVLDAAGRHHHLGRVAVAAVDRGEQVALLHLRRLPGAGAAALHVDDDERDLGHHRQPQALLLERIARARGDGHRAAAGVGGADGEGAGGDLVLGLVHEAADASRSTRSGSARPRSPA